MTEPRKDLSDATAETHRLQKPKGLEPGETVAEFRLVRELGRGGMGVVYLAHDEKLDRDVALKLFFNVPQLGPEYEARFLREARNAARLDHPNVVQVYSTGRVGEISYIAMQYVKGKTLATLLAERGFFKPEEALKIVADVCRALSAAHELGIVHRDIKPSNVMIEETGRVKVMDFGLSRGIAGGDYQKVTQSGIYLGTPEYSSPEQCETNEIDGRSDIYSLGVVLYEMLSGRTPYSAPTPLALFKKIVEEVPPPIGSLVPTLSRSVCTLVEKMMAKDRNNRYATARDVVADIEKILAGQKPIFREVAAGVARTAQLDRSVRARAASSRRVATLAACALLVVAVVAAAVFTNFFGADDDRVSPHQQPDIESANDFGTVPEADNDRASPNQQPDPVAPTPISSDTNVTPLSLPLSTVVFDFRNTTGSREHEWMELGIPEMLIAELNQAGFLRVVTRDELVLEMRKVAGKKIIIGDSVSGGTPEKLPLTPETQRLLTHFDAQLVVCGSFLAPGDQVKIIADVYTTGECRGDPAPVETSSAAPTQARIEHLVTRDVVGAVVDVFSLVDKLSQSLTEAIRHKLPPLDAAVAITAMKARRDVPLAVGDAKDAFEPLPPPLEFLESTIERRKTGLTEKIQDEIANRAIGAEDGMAIETLEGGPVREQEKGSRPTAKGATGMARGIAADVDKGEERDTPKLEVPANEAGQHVKQEETDEQLSEKALGLKCQMEPLVKLKKLSEKDLFEIARLRWKMKKIVEDSETQDSPKVKTAMRVLQLIEHGEDLSRVLRIAIEGKFEEGDLIWEESK